LQGKTALWRGKREEKQQAISHKTRIYVLWLILLVDCCYLAAVAVWTAIAVTVAAV
jgi:hypothetical protein